MKGLGRWAFALLAVSILRVAQAADFPAPQEGSWTARDFHFHTGEVMAELTR